MKSVVMLSGGYDSAALLAWLVDRVEPVSTLFVDYGQPSRGEECIAASEIARHYRVHHAALTIDGLRICDGEIPARNALLVSLALAAAPEARTIGLGIHAGAPYWDCSEDFVSAMQRVADGYCGGRVQIAAPFVAFGKTDIYAIGRSLGVPEALTYSCERSAGPCGACASCLDEVEHARA